MKRKRLTLLIACLLLISAIRMADGSPKRVLTTLGIYFGDHIAYSPDGRLLALADSNLLFLLDAETLTQVGTFMQYGARNSINAMDFSPDGRWLAAGNGDGIITIWDVHKMTEKFTIQAYERRAGDLEPRGEVVDIAFHPDSKTLASVGDYGIIKFWNVATGKEIRSFKDVGNTIAFHPIGKFLASGSGVWPGEHGPETVQIWDLDSEQVLFALPTQEYIFEVAFTPNPDERVVAFSTNRKTKLWKNWQLQNQVITLETEGNTRHPVFTPDGRTLITAGDAIRFWDVETGNLIRIFPNSESRTIALHPDGNRLATVSSLDHHLQILDTAKGELINELDVSNVINSVLNISFSADEKRLIAISRQRLIQQWELTTGKNPFSRLLNSSSPLYYSVFSPDGRQLAAVSDKIYVWDAATGEQLQTIDHRGILLAYSVDGILAMGNLEGDIQLLDAPTGELKHTLQTNAERISALAFSPDGQLLASGNSDGLIQLWDVRAGAMLREMKGHQKSHLRFSTNRSGVLALAFSPDGHLLASGGGWFDYKVRLWDVATGTPLRILEEHITSLESLDFSPDGKLLASGSHPEGGHGSVNVWDVATGRLRKTFRLGSWRVRFSPSGKQLAFVIPGHILVWNSDELLFDTTPVTPKGLKPISWGELRVSALLSNYPNPANPETWIPYQLAQPAPVVIRIYNQKGQVVRTLSLGKKNAGFYFTKDKAAYWDGKDGFGQSVASGIYFYTLQTGEFSATRKLVLLK